MENQSWLSRNRKNLFINALPYGTKLLLVLFMGGFWDLLFFGPVSLLLICWNYAKCGSRRDFLLTQLFQAGCIALAGVGGTLLYLTFVSDDPMSAGLGYGITFLELLHLSVVTLIAAPGKGERIPSAGKRGTLLAILVALPFLLKILTMGMSRIFDLILLPSLMIAAILLSGSWTRKTCGLMFSGLYMSAWVVAAEWIVAAATADLMEQFQRTYSLDRALSESRGLVLAELGIIWLAVVVTLWLRRRKNRKQ